MKKSFMLAVICCTVLVNLAAQNVRVNPGVSPVEASALLDIKSTDKGMLLPAMTSGERSTIINPAKGLLVFQTDGTAGFYYYDGRLWLSLTGGGLTNSDGFSPAYAVTTVFVGSTYGYTNGIGVAAKFTRPYGISIDHAGNIYMADMDNHSIRKINPTGNTTTLAGSTVSGNTDGVGVAARFNFPDGVTVGTDGNIYVADTYNNLIRKITPTGTVTTVAGSGWPGIIDGHGTAAAFNQPLSMVADTAGNIFIADYNSIRKMTPNRDVTTLAGNTNPGSSDGTGAAASFSRPGGLVLDAAGNLYVADRDNHKIRKVTPAGVVTTFAGTGSPGDVDGNRTTATFNSPKAIAIDAAGNFYIADAGNHKIRKISPDGTVSTLAGNGSAGFSDGQFSSAYFNDPSGLVIDEMGNLYVADSGNHVIRKIIIR
jgi:sugar lactone lactonase YvrE